MVFFLAGVVFGLEESTVDVRLDFCTLFYPGGAFPTNNKLSYGGDDGWGGMWVRRD